MPLTKRDAAVAVGVGLFVLAGRKAMAGTGKQTVKTAPPKLDPNADGANLLKRANQKSATAWASIFADHPVSPLVAQALARWAGIESSGNATAKSRLDERGLLQVGAQTVGEGGTSAAEWAALVSPSTTKKQHAAIAVKYADWLARQASTYVRPFTVDPVDMIWYAKLWHQRPVDVRDVVGPTATEVGTPAAQVVARALAIKWAGDPKAMHRLRAANVIAFGTPTP